MKKSNVYLILSLTACTAIVNVAFASDDGLEIIKNKTESATKAVNSFYLFQQTISGSIPCKAIMPTTTMDYEYTKKNPVGKGDYRITIQPNHSDWSIDTRLFRWVAIEYVRGTSEECKEGLSNGYGFAGEQPLSTPLDKEKFDALNPLDKINIIKSTGKNKSITHFQGKFKDGLPHGFGIHTKYKAVNDSLVVINIFANFTNGLPIGPIYKTITFNALKGDGDIYFDIFGIYGISSYDMQGDGGNMSLEQLDEYIHLRHRRVYGGFDFGYQSYGRESLSDKLTLSSMPSVPYEQPYFVRKYYSLPKSRQGDIESYVRDMIKKGFPITADSDGLISQCLIQSIATKKHECGGPPFQRMLSSAKKYKSEIEKSVRLIGDAIENANNEKRRLVFSSVENLLKAASHTYADQEKSLAGRYFSLYNIENFISKNSQILASSGIDPKISLDGSFISFSIRNPESNITSSVAFNVDVLDYDFLLGAPVPTHESLRRGFSKKMLAAAMEFPSAPELIKIIQAYPELLNDVEVTRAALEAALESDEVDSLLFIIDNFPQDLSIKADAHFIRLMSDQGNVNDVSKYSKLLKARERDSANKKLIDLAVADKHYWLLAEVARKEYGYIGDDTAASADDILFRILSKDKGKNGFAEYVELLPAGKNVGKAIMAIWENIEHKGKIYEAIEFYKKFSMYTEVPNLVKNKAVGLLSDGRDIDGLIAMANAISDKSWLDAVASKAFDRIAEKGNSNSTKDEESFSQLFSLFPDVAAANDRVTDWLLRNAAIEKDFAYNALESKNYIHILASAMPTWGFNSREDPSLEFKRMIDKHPIVAICHLKYRLLKKQFSSEIIDDPNSWEQTNQLWHMHNDASPLGPNAPLPIEAVGSISILNGFKRGVLLNVKVEYNARLASSEMRYLEGLGNVLTGKKGGWSPIPSSINITGLAPASHYNAEEILGFGHDKSDAAFIISDVPTCKVSSVKFIK